MMRSKTHPHNGFPQTYTLSVVLSPHYQRTFLKVVNVLTDH